MMRCSRFRYHAPRTLAEATAILRDEGPDAMLIAGGTDLVPNMKRRQQTPKVLVSLRRIAALPEAGLPSGKLGQPLALGAMTTIARIATDPVVTERFTAAARAAAQIASPQIQNMGTVGGNLCLDTRCNYYNQNYEWRKAIDFCMKAPASSEGRARPAGDDGVCWVAPGSPRCWAVSSSDLAPALIALGVQVRLVSADGERTLPLEALYHDDGMRPLSKRTDEILTTALLPEATGWRSTYWKLRRRESFDFPVLSVAAAVRAHKGVIEEARLVFGAVGSRPVVATAAAEALRGRAFDDDAIAEIAEMASRFAKPLDNTDYALGWRKRVAKRFVDGALRELRGDDPRAVSLLARRATAPFLPVVM